MPLKGQSLPGAQGQKWSDRPWTLKMIIAWGDWGVLEVGNTMVVGGAEPISTVPGTPELMSSLLLRGAGAHRPNFSH